MTEIVAKTYSWKDLPYYTRVTVVGLSVYAVLFAFFGVLVAIQGDTETLIFLAPFAILTAIFAALAWRLGKWWALVAGIWAIVNLLFNGPFIIPSLLHFNSFFDAGLGTPVVISLIVAAVAGITVFVQHRRGAARNVSNAGERRAVTVIVAGVMLLSGVLHLTSIESISAGDKEGAMLVAMEDSKFAPKQLRVKAGEPARFVVKNRDLVVHTFTIKELGVDVSIITGSETLIKLPSIAAGTYEYVCTVSGHDNMKGTLVATE